MLRSGVSWLDFKLAVRMLVKHPGLTLVAVLALSVAIGTGAGYLELLNDLFRPRLALSAGDRLVGLYQHDAEDGQARQATIAELRTWRRELTRVRDLGGYRPLERNLLTADGRAAPVEGAEITSDAFQVAAVPPLLGRPLVTADEAPGAPAVVVLGHDLWRSRFRGDPAAIGQTVRLGRVPHTVVGVMPPGFAFPINQALWVPLQMNGLSEREAEAASVRAFGSLVPGATLAQAQAELDAAAARAAAVAPAGRGMLRPQVRGYVEALWAGQKDGVLQMRILYGLNLFFVGLLCVCGANVATLVFARTATREAEITVRTALGARRGRIVGLLFAEALVLASVAAVVGLAGAALLARAVGRAVEGAGGVLPFWWNDRLSPGTVLYGAGLTLVTALLVGVLPALRATGPALQARLRNAAAGGSGMRFGRLWTGVIVGQVALTVVFLLVIASLAWNVRAGRFGAPSFTFDAASYLSARIESDDASGVDLAAREAFSTRSGALYEEMRQRLTADPAVTGVTFGSHLAGDDAPWSEMEVEGAAARAGEGGTFSVRVPAVAIDYFEVFGARLLAGRVLREGDLAEASTAVVVNRSFVREVLGTRDAVGLRLRSAGEAGEAPGEWREIVGVVDDLVHTPGDRIGTPIMYRPATPSQVYPLKIAVRTAGDARPLAALVRRTISATDPSLRLYDLAPISESGREAQMVLSFVMKGLGLIVGVALLLAAAGVYSLMSYTVSRQTREIGIRAALGADPQRLVRGIFAPALGQVALGVLVGSVPGSALVGLGAPEVARGGGALVAVGSFAAVASFMMVVAAVACAVPVRRALAIQPTDALRAGG